VHHPSRDQTETRQAIDDLDELIRRFPRTRWSSAGLDLKRQAEDNLAASEHLVGQFYLKRKAYGAAIERFRGLLDRFPSYAQRDKTLFQMASALVELDRQPEARVYLDLLLTDHPGGRWADEARELLAELDVDRAGVTADGRRPA
jgi:outer membrane protein assembly factor BamD